MGGSIAFLISIGTGVSQGLILLEHVTRMMISSAVGCGGLFGIGMVNGRTHLGTIGEILTAWVTTLPVAAVLAGLTWHLLGG